MLSQSILRLPLYGDWRTHQAIPLLVFHDRCVEKVRSIKCYLTIALVSRTRSNIESTKPRILNHCSKILNFRTFSTVSTRSCHARPHTSSQFSGTGGSALATHYCSLPHSRFYGIGGSVSRFRIPEGPLVEEKLLIGLSWSLENLSADGQRGCARRCGLVKSVGWHRFRHSFATHPLGGGYDNAC